MGEIHSFEFVKIDRGQVKRCIQNFINEQTVYTMAWQSVPFADEDAVRELIELFLDETETHMSIDNCIEKIAVN